MAYARLIAGTWEEVAGPFVVGNGLDAYTYPAGWLDGATPEQLDEVGAAPIVEEPPVAGSPGPALVDVDGVPHRRWLAPAIGDLRAARRAEVAAIRWTRQQSMKWRGRIVLADDTTTGRIMGAVMRAQITGEQGGTVRWKFGDNDFDELSLEDIRAYGLAIGVHLQACYDREAELVAEINTAVGVANLAAIDVTAGWPA